MKASQNGKGKRPKTPKPKPVTALQVVPKKPGGGPPKTSETRKRFLFAYENTFGNVSAACEYAGVSRMTFYRWMRSTTAINRKFKLKLEALKPDEAFVDSLESALVGRVKAMDTTAIIYGLKAKGKHRGWSDRAEDPKMFDEDGVTKLLDAFEKVRNEHPNMTEAERALWIRDFAQSGGVPEDALLRRIRVKELTEGK